MAKLWEKGYNLDESVERFTVGRDFQLDRQLLVADAVASIAHVRGLLAAGLLDQPSADSLEKELQEIARRGRRGEVGISRSDEDCHTVLENLLTERLGEAGKRVHTGRSRNDQVTAATRLMAREALLVNSGLILDVVALLLDRAEAEKDTVMPGRTHLQIAMLSTFGLWLASWAEQLLDDLDMLLAAARLNDRSPLGSAASYGVPLPLNRQLVSDLLGFQEVQNNVLAVQHSRGSLDGVIVGTLAGVAATLGRMAQDLILYSLPEIGYVRLPAQLCSGSSIMPQKRNPDVLELMRSRAAVLEGWATQCRGVVRNLPSGYNRDLQDTKEPLLRSLEALREELLVSGVLIRELEPQREAMAAALNKEVFATDYAYQLVREGLPFREAYLRAAKEYAEQPIPEAATALAQRTSQGTPGNLNLAAPRQRMHQRAIDIAALQQRHRVAVEALGGAGFTSVLVDEADATRSS